MNYSNGKREGEYLGYYKDGSLKVKLTYKNGTDKFEGNRETNYEKDGSIRGEFEFRNGEWERYETDSRELTFSRKSTLPVKGGIKSREWENNGKRLRLRIRINCPHCDNLIKYDDVSFQEDRLGDCDKKTYNCDNCGGESYLKPCSLKGLSEGDDF